MGFYWNDASIASDIKRSKFDLVLGFVPHLNTNCSLTWASMGRFFQRAGRIFYEETSQQSESKQLNGKFVCWPTKGFQTTRLRIVNPTAETSSGLCKSKKAFLVRQLLWEPGMEDILTIVDSERLIYCIYNVECYRKLWNGSTTSESPQSVELQFFSKIHIGGTEVYRSCEWSILSWQCGKHCWPVAETINSDIQAISKPLMRFSCFFNSWHAPPDLRLIDS